MGSPSDVEGAPARVKKSGRGAKESPKKGRREPGEARGREATAGRPKESLKIGPPGARRRARGLPRGRNPPVEWTAGHVDPPGRPAARHREEPRPPRSAGSSTTSPSPPSSPGSASGPTVSPRPATARKRRSSRWGTHTHLAVFLAIAMMVTIAVISASYAQIIRSSRPAAAATSSRRASSGRGAGVVSGSALVVDYAMTIAMQVAASSRRSASSRRGRAPAGAARPRADPRRPSSIILNLRGVKESVLVLVPIFLLFLRDARPPRRSSESAATRRRCPRSWRRRPAETRDDVDRARGFGTLALLLRGLLDGRRDLHGNRGDLERAPDPARAARPDRPADDALHGGLPLPHGGRADPLLPPRRSAPRPGPDAERGPDGEAGDRGARAGLARRAGSSS